VTLCRPETRTQNYQVCNYVQEQRVRQVQYQVCVPQQRTGTREVTTCRVVPEQQTATRTIQVPYTVQKQVPYQVCRMVPKTVTCQVPVMVPCNTPCDGCQASDAGTQAASDNSLTGNDDRKASKNLGLVGRFRRWR
jgi:hypothetical protein